MAATHVQNVKILGSEKTLCLYENMKLYINSELFAKDVTNFFICENFLLFVRATQGLLYSLYLYDLNEGLPVYGNEQPAVLPEGADSFNVRSVERGSRIVTASGVKVILQMPRGNIETLYPRLLMFKALRRLIVESDPPEYQAAFLMLRQHKINFNLLYDLNPVAF